VHDDEKILNIYTFDKYEPSLCRSSFLLVFIDAWNKYLLLERDPKIV